MLVFVLKAEKKKLAAEVEVAERICVNFQVEVEASAMMTLFVGISARVGLRN